MKCSLGKVILLQSFYIINLFYTAQIPGSVFLSLMKKDYVLFVLTQKEPKKSRLIKND